MPSNGVQDSVDDPLGLLDRVSHDLFVIIFTQEAQEVSEFSHD
jgi:hypothetical protein